MTDPKWLIEELRTALIESGRASGAFIDATVTSDFLLLVPAEVRRALAERDDALTQALADVETLREAGKALVELMRNDVDSLPVSEAWNDLRLALAKTERSGG